MFVLFVLVLPGTCAAVPVIICGGFYTDCLKGYIILADFKRT